MKGPTRREWLLAFLKGLEHSRFTGAVSLALRLADGRITQLQIEDRKKELGG